MGNPASYAAVAQVELTAAVILRRFGMSLGAGMTRDAMTGVGDDSAKVGAVPTLAVKKSAPAPQPARTATERRAHRLPLRVPLIGPDRRSDGPTPPCC